MYDREKESLRNGFDALAPDLFDKIKSATETSEESRTSNVISINSGKRKKNVVLKKSFISGISVAAAVCIMFVTLNWAILPSPQKQIIIDVNPSVAINLNEQNEVEKVEALNDDAKKIVENVSETGTVEEVVLDVLEELQSNDYFKKHSEMLLTYVCKENAEMPCKQVEETVKEYVEKEEPQLKVTYQSVKPDKSLMKNAKKQGVSLGRYYYQTKSINSPTKTTSPETASPKVEVNVDNVNNENDKKDIGKKEQKKQTNKNQKEKENKFENENKGPGNNSAEEAKDNKGQQKKQENAAKKQERKEAKQAQKEAKKAAKKARKEAKKAAKAARKAKKAAAKAEKAAKKATEKADKAEDKSEKKAEKAEGKEKTPKSKNEF